MTRNMSSGSDLSSLGEPAAIDSRHIVDSEHAASMMTNSDSTTSYVQDARGASASSLGGAVPFRMAHWQLGMAISARAPAAIMAEVYRALAAVGATWKTVTPYCVKCLQEFPLPPDSRVDTFVKMMVQLYKLPSGKYLIDFQRTSGNLACFVESVKTMTNQLACIS